MKFTFEKQPFLQVKETEAGTFVTFAAKPAESRSAEPGNPSVQSTPRAQTGEPGGAQTYDETKTLIEGAERGQHQASSVLKTGAAADSRVSADRAGIPGVQSEAPVEVPASTSAPAVPAAPEAPAVPEAVSGWGEVAAYTAATAVIVGLAVLAFKGWTTHDRVDARVVRGGPTN